MTLSLLRPLRAGATLLLVLTLLTGLAYPLAMTGLARLLVPGPAAGSLILRDGQPVGSALVGQAFAQPGYLHPRPSASGYDTRPSAASNLGPTAGALQAAVAERRAQWAGLNGGVAPLDAVTASASGLDPHVSPANARGQAARIATARGLPLPEVLALIAAATEGRWLGLYGEPRVDVLRVNLALDAARPLAPAEAN